MSERLTEVDELKRKVLEVVEQYTHASSLHNYGPGGLSRVEEAEIRTGRFIMEDLQALFESLKGPRS